MVRFLFQSPAVDNFDTVGILRQGNCVFVVDFVLSKSKIGNSTEQQLCWKVMTDSLQIGWICQASIMLDKIFESFKEVTESDNDEDTP